MQLALLMTYSVSAPTLIIFLVVISHSSLMVNMKVGWRSGTSLIQLSKLHYTSNVDLYQYLIFIIRTLRCFDSIHKSIPQPRFEPPPLQTTVDVRPKGSELFCFLERKGMYPSMEHIPMKDIERVWRVCKNKIQIYWL